MTNCEAAFFDLDGTILSLSSEKLFCYELWQRGLLSERNLVRVLWIFCRYELGVVQEYETLKCSVLETVLPGLSQIDVQARAEQFFRERQKPGIRQEAIAEIELHRSAGRRLYIVSSTLDCLVDPVGEYLGIEARYMTCLQVNRGQYTGQVSSSIFYGQGKANLLRRLAAEDGLNLATSFAYGDSIQDAPMLRLVGHPCAVRPDRRLRKLARDNHWQIAEWT